MDWIQEGIQHGASFLNPKMFEHVWYSKKHHNINRQQHGYLENSTDIGWNKASTSWHQEKDLPRRPPLSITLCCNQATTKLGKMKAEDRLHKNTTPINHLQFTDDLKLYGTNRDQLDPLVQTVRIFSEDIQMSYLDWTSVQCWKGKEESKLRARE